MKNSIILGLTFLFLGTVSTPAFAEDGEKTYKKGIFTFNYPEKGWTVDELAPPEGKKGTYLKLTAAGKPHLAIMLTWDPAAESTGGKSPPNPAVLGHVFGMPIALAAAEKKEENIVSTLGLINIADETQLSARFVIKTPGSAVTKSVDSFAYLSEEHPGNVIMGAIVAGGSQMQSDITDDYYARLHEAYGIVQSASFN